MERSLLPAAALLALALLPGPAAASGEGEGERPAYALPEGFSRGSVLPDRLAASVARAVRDVTRPSSPWAASEGWRILAGIGPGAAPAAVEALRDADWFGRSLLVRALGSMESLGLEPLLVQAAGDPAWAVREAAAEGLGLAAGGDSSRVLAALLGDPSWRVRRTAVESLRRRALRGTAPREAAAAALDPLARDPDEDVRRAAWLALADLREPRARDALLEALRSLADRVQGRSAEDPPDPEMATALRLLRGVAEGWPGDREVRDLLGRIGEVSYHPLAGAALREWFRAAGPEGAADREALGRLVDVYLEDDADPDSRAAAESALVALGEPAASTLLARVAVPQRARRGGLAYGALRDVLRLVLRLRGPRAPETLEGILRDRLLSPTLRLHAADLGRRTCPRALGPVFRELLAAGEGNASLDAHLLKGVAASGGADVAGILAAALVRTGEETPPRHLRAAAAEVLESRPALADPAVLRSALRAETDPEVLARLLRVVAEAEGSAAVDAIAPFLRDRRLRVRRAAVESLHRAPGGPATTLLLGVLEAEDGNDDRLPWHGEGEPTEAQREELRAVMRANAAGVRETAVSSLRFAAGEGAGALLTGLLGSPEPEVRGAAAENLATMGVGAAASVLAARIREEEGGSLRDRLLAALVSLEGPAADAACESLLASGDEGLRTATLDALGGEGVLARAPEGLRRCLAPGGAGVLERLAALRALGRTADASLTPLLLDALAGAASGEEKRAALEGLGFTRDPAAVEAVAALLPGGPPALLDPDALETATQAVETLGELRSPAAVPALATLLGRTLPGALSGSRGRAASADRQVAVLCIRALGQSGGEAALEVLLRTALHPALSRGAEAATTNPLRPPLPRKEGERWRPEVPEEVRGLAWSLVASLARWKDGVLAAALERRLAEMRSDGSAYALGEDWLYWLGSGLAEPPRLLPARPRWWTKVVLARQVLANVPRLSEADGEAARTLYSHEAEVTTEYGAARERLLLWRECQRLHDPLAEEKSRRSTEGLLGALEAARALREAPAAADPEALLRAFEEAGREDRVARLGVEVLKDLRLHPAVAVRLGEAAVGADASYPPNLRALGEARLAAGDAPGAAEILALALEELDGDRPEPSRASSWYRFHGGRALEALGRREEALRLLASGARLSDVVLDWIDRDPSLAALRGDPRAEEAFRAVREAFAE